VTKPKWQTAEKHGETWHERGETWERARKLYLAHPFISPADLSRVLGISRARFYACVKGLEREREQLCEAALKRIKAKEGL
jgi:hypothetical protein